MTGTEWDESFERLVRTAVPALDGTALTPDLDLKAAGLDSMAAVELLLEIEAAYDITIPDESLTGSVFATPAGLWSVIAGLLPAG